MNLAEFIQAEIERVKGDGVSALHGLMAQVHKAREQVCDAINASAERLDCRCDECKRDFHVTLTVQEQRDRGIPEICVECWELGMAVKPPAWMSDEPRPIRSVYRGEKYEYVRDA